MIKILVGLAAFAAFIACDREAFGAELDVAKVNDVMKATIQLNKNCSGEIIFSDRDKQSGEVKTLILTAKHCTADTQNVRNQVDVPVYDDDARVTSIKSYYADVVSNSYKSDLSMLRLQDKNTIFPTIHIAKDKTHLSVGESVIVAGFPGGLEAFWTEGRLMTRGNLPFNFPTEGKDTEYLRSTAPIMGGNSGGGLYHLGSSGDYELIGTTDLGFRGNPQMGFYVPLERINEYLQSTDSVAFPKDPTAAGPVLSAPTVTPKTYQ